MAEKSCLGASGLTASVTVSLVDLASVVDGVGLATFRSEVADGSVEETWLGTAMGVEMGPLPPAAMAAAAGAVVALVSSSSQSISSSPAGGALIVAVVNRSY